MLRGVWSCQSLICYSTACNPDDRAERAYRERRGSEPSLEWGTKESEKTGFESMKGVGGGGMGGVEVTILSAMLQCYSIMLARTKGRNAVHGKQGAPLVCHADTSGMWALVHGWSLWREHRGGEAGERTSLFRGLLQRNIKGQSWLTQFSATSVEARLKTKERKK